MIYAFLASVAIYMVLVAACNASQRNEVCFTGLRAFIVALALIAFVDFMTGQDISISATEEHRGTAFEQVLSLPSAEAGSRASHSEEARMMGKSGSQYRLAARAGEFLMQGEQEPIMSHSAARRVSRFHAEDRKIIAARTAMIGILLSRVGK